MNLILLFVSIVPIVLIGVYIYEKDNEKEPKALLMELFASGVLATFLVIGINILIALTIPDLYVSNNYTNFSRGKLFYLMFFEIALVEELCKWFMIKYIGYNNREFDQLYDIIVYSVFVALGFAAIENIFYVLPGGVSLGIYRAIFSVPGHVAFGIFMGYFLGLAKIEKNKLKHHVYISFSILVPAFLHTIYNYCLMNEQFWYIVLFIGFVVLLYLGAIKRITQFSKDSKYIK